MKKESHLMKCGCANNAVRTKGDKDIPVCSYHDCEEILPRPELKGRWAECLYCENIRDSSLDLPFFQYRPGNFHDWYVCGCKGWD